MAAGVRSSCSMSSSLRSMSSRRRRIKQEAIGGGHGSPYLIRNASMRPRPPLQAGAPVRRPSASCLGEWQEALSLPNLRAEHPLVASPTSRRLAHLRQIFVRRCHGRKRPRPHGDTCWPGQVKQSGSKVEFGPIRSARQRTERFLSGGPRRPKTCQIAPKSCSSLPSVITN